MPIPINDGGPDNGVGVAGHGLLTLLGAHSCNGQCLCFRKGELDLGQQIVDIVEQMAGGLNATGRRR